MKNVFYCTNPPEAHQRAYWLRELWYQLISNKFFSLFYSFVANINILSSPDWNTQQHILKELIVLGKHPILAASLILPLWALRIWQCLQRVGVSNWKIPSLKDSPQESPFGFLNQDLEYKILMVVGFFPFHVALHPFLLLGTVRILSRQWICRESGHLSRTWWEQRSCHAVMCGHITKPQYTLSLPVI